MAIDYDFRLKANTTSIVYNGPGDKDTVINDFQQRINESLKKGRVFVFENELIPEPHRRYMYARFTPADYIKTYRPYYPFLIPIDSLSLYGKMIKIYQIDKGALGAVMDSSKGISIQ
jgi:hypothetical protein